ncbi:MAG: transglutaminase domain-containing protein [Nitriliruptoraceae bacterium]|nr:transglutaminase domain-containing protein [Nitriliruptoraceae bacterium]
MSTDVHAPPSARSTRRHGGARRPEHRDDSPSILTRLAPVLRIGQTVAVHLVALAMIAVAMLPWTTVLEGPARWVTVLGAVAGGALIAVAARVLRLPAVVEAATSALSLLVFLLFAVVRDPLGFGAIARGLRDGLPRILSTTLPVLDVSWIAVPGAVIGWVAAASVLAAVGRRGLVAAPIGIALLVFAGGYAATLQGSAADLVELARGEALGLVAAATLLVLLRTRQRVPAGQQLRVVGRVGLALVSVGGGVALASVLIDVAPYLADEPVAPRIVVEVDERQPTSPLLVTRELRGDDAERIVGRVDRDDVAFVPFAVLSRYDGRVWTLTQPAFQPTGGTVPVSMPIGEGGTARFVDVDTDATGGWLPFVTRPLQIAGTSVLHNGGEALQLADAAPQASYEVLLAQPPVLLDDPELPDDARVARGAVGALEVPDPSGDNRPAGERLCRLLAVSRNPNAERAVDGEPCGQRGPDTVAFVRALTTELRTGRSVPEDLIGGLQLEVGSESLADLLDLVSQSGTQGAVGSPEQFASSFALIAADFGLPVRVVTGFRLPEGGGSERTITGADAWTWAEVPVEGVGWVVVDPSPSGEEAIEEEELEQAEDVATDEDETEVSAPDRSVVEVDPSQSLGRAPVEEPRGPLGWILVGVAGLLVLLGAVLLQAAIRRSVRRRRRRGADDARAQVLGAWHELIDAVYDGGHREVESLTASEVTTFVGERAPELREEATAFAEAANRVVFSSRPVPEGEAERWWTLVAQLRRAVRRGAPRQVRLTALLVPAPTGLTAERPPPAEVSRDDDGSDASSRRRRPVRV